VGPEGSGHPCPRCGAEVAPTLLSCPKCSALVYGAELTRLAAEAEGETANGDRHRALELWREALALLPQGCSQHRAVTAKVTALVEGAGVGETQAPASSKPPRERKKKGALGAIAGTVAAAGLLIWKLKFVGVFLLTKGKLLLLGLTKASTFLSMFLALGVYWAVFGWKFALGLVLSIYVHEMGHVASLQRFGIKASAPTFVPGFGAFVRLKQHPATVGEDARVGLAGPIAGVACALFALAVGHLADWPAWIAIARVGAWINLFNLLPVWQLDGGRAWNALSKRYRWYAVGAIALAWVLSSEAMLILLLIAGIARAATGRAPEKPDKVALWQYMILVAVAAALCTIEVPGLAALR